MKTVLYATNEAVIVRIVCCMRTVMTFCGRLRFLEGGVQTQRIFWIENTGCESKPWIVFAEFGLSA